MYDIRDYPSNLYVVRKLADGNCWQIDNLNYALSSGTATVASKNDRSTFTFTPTSCDTNEACPLNGNTHVGVDTHAGQWYYNWYASTAGIGTLEDYNVDIDGSICPVGWTMPKYYGFDSGRSFRNLYEAYDLPISGINDGIDQKLKSYPLAFKATAFYIDGIDAINYGYIDGGYYGGSSTSLTYERHFYALGLAFAPDQSWASWTYEKKLGYSARCLAL